MMMMSKDRGLPSDGSWWGLLPGLASHRGLPMDLTAALAGLQTGGDTEVRPSHRKTHS
jgi:hypothetical protein